MRTFSLKKPESLNEPTTKTPEINEPPVKPPSESEKLQSSAVAETLPLKEIDRINRLPPTELSPPQLVELYVKLNDTKTAIRLSYDPEGQHYIDLPRHQAICLMQLLGRLALKLGHRVRKNNEI